MFLLNFSRSLNYNFLEEINLENIMSEIYRNDQALREKVRRIMENDPAMLMSLSHEAHYLLEQGMISEGCYQEIYELAKKYVTQK